MRPPDYALIATACIILFQQTLSMALDVEALWKSHLTQQQRQGREVRELLEKTWRDDLRQSPKDNKPTRKLFHLYTDHEEYTLAAILAFHLSHQFPESDAFSSALKNYPKNASSVLFTNAVEYQKTWAYIESALHNRRIERAEIALRLLLKRYPKEKKLWKYVGGLFIYQQEWAMSAMLYRFYRETFGSDLESHNNYALSLYMQGHKDDAIKEMEILRTTYPESVMVFKNSALHALLENGKKTATYAGRWAALDRNNYNAWIFYGTQLLERKQWILAKTALDKAHRLNPEALSPLFHLARADFYRGEEKKAAAWLTKTRERLSNVRFEKLAKTYHIPLELMNSPYLKRSW